MESKELPSWKGVCEGTELALIDWAKLQPTRLVGLR